MYAVVSTGGKQYKVEEGEILKVEKIPGKVGTPVAFDKVLMLSDGEKVSVGTPVLDDVAVNGHPENRLPGVSNITFKYIEGESILLRLDREGIAVSTGSACSTGSLSPSHVLISMGVPHENAHGSIRFSLGYGNTENEVHYTLEKLVPIVEELRALSPLNPLREGSLT